MIITVDTLRADHLGCYGYFRDTSPSVDRLAREGLLFERCLAPVSQTLPTHTSLFTGLQPYEHGIQANVDDKRVYRPSPDIQTFAQALREAGYRTAAFVSAEPVKRGGGLDKGFEHWSEPEKYSVRADETVDAVIDWLGKGPAEPTALWVHLFDPHRPYAPRGKYAELFPSDERQAAYLAEREVAPVNAAEIKAYKGTGRTEGDHNAYDGEVRFVDDQLGRLFDHLRGVGLWDGMAVVFTSDHGEGLMQHGRMGHGRIWLETMHVPCILKVPGLAPGRTDLGIGTRDILPTLMARIPALEDSSWLEQATGIDALAPGVPQRPLFSQNPTSKLAETHAVVEDGWRLIVGATTRLYDLSRDPHELHDLAASEPERVAAMTRSLAARVAEQRALGERLGAGEMEVISERRRKGLEALGYTGEGEDE